MDTKLLLLLAAAGVHQNKCVASFQKECACCFSHRAQCTLCLIISILFIWCYSEKAFVGDDIVYFILYQINLLWIS